MRFKRLLSALLALSPLAVQAQKQYLLTSPDSRIEARVSIDKQLSYNVSVRGKHVIEESPLSMTLTNGTVWGSNPRLASAKTSTVNATVKSPFYRATDMTDRYNALTLRFKGGWNVEFRAYDDGVAYRFVSTLKKPFRVKNETAGYNFTSDATVTAAYSNGEVTDRIESQFSNSFENRYNTLPISKLERDRLMFLPLAVQTESGVKVAVTETNIENYPGMYLVAQQGRHALKAMYAPRPNRMKQGGHNMLQMRVESRHDYIAEVTGPRTFPWRIAVIAEDDATLAQTNLSYLLAEPSRVADTSWIKPGKVAWDWWNDWNIDGVDFKSGVNNDTYKYYIDFASKKGIEYVILDEGWAVNLKADLMQVIDGIDLKELVDYAAKRNVGLILWAGYWAFDRDMEQVCKHYSEMGIKGFKVDFMDRDDQIMTDFEYRAAATCAKYHLLLDLHGTYKPAGMNRTYPNVLNFEGVHGLEQMKWQPVEADQVTYDVQLPFLRQLSGPMDYTQGAMRNATRDNYRPCNSEPMSQGTRCRQLAMYMVFDSPLTMLCDNPSNYMREPECADFIAKVPTTWDETRVINAKMGEYIVTARCKGSKWYIGGMTDWTPRDITIDLSFIGKQNAQAVIFKDGINADRAARDYKRTAVTLDTTQPLTLHMAPGGGFAMEIE